MKIPARARIPVDLSVYAQCLAQWPAYSRSQKHPKILDVHSSIHVVFFLHNWLPQCLTSVVMKSMLSFRVFPSV